MVAILRAPARNALLWLIFVTLVACSTQPTHTLIEKSAQNHTVEGQERYATKQQRVPPAVRSLIKQARVNLEQARYEQALSAAERAQRIAPKVSEIYLVLGKAYQGLSKPRQANNMFHRAKALATNNNDRRRAERALQEGEQ